MSGGEQAQGEHTGGAGLLLSACRLHLSSSRGVGGDGGGMVAASRPTGGAKRRRLEPEQQQSQQQQQQQQQRREDGGRSQTSGDGAVSAGVGSPPCGPFRVLLTTGKTASSSNNEASSKSISIQDRRAAATAAAGSGRLLSSVAMDLAHSLALRSSSLSSSSSSSSSSSVPLCRGCGAKHGRTSNTRTSTSSQQCQCVDVVYILYEPASSAGYSGGEHTPGLPGGDGGDEEEEVGAVLFPLRCRRMVGAAMDAHGTSNDNDDAEGNGADQPTNSRCCSESPSSSPSWDEAALSRIQIRRMRDGADLVRYLATVPLLPPHQQPLRGIVLNDIGSFVLGNTGKGDSTGGGGGAGAGGTVSNSGGQGVVPGPSSFSSPPSLGPSYHTIDSSIVLTQIRKSSNMHGRSYVVRRLVYDAPN